MHDTKIPTIYGLLAEFSSDRAMVRAARKVRVAGFKRIDAFMPFPIHGIHEVLGQKNTKLNLVMLVAGAAGAMIGLGLQWWICASANPFIVAGKPFFSWPSFIPVIFECTVLVSAVTGFFVLWGRNDLPRLHHPLFAIKEFERASTDKFFIVIKSDDPLYDDANTREFLKSIGAENIYEVPMDGATEID